MAGEWLTATANTNMFTYEIAPVFILMESVVLTKMREIIGWKGGDSIFAPGHNMLYYCFSAHSGLYKYIKLKKLFERVFIPADRWIDIKHVCVFGSPTQNVSRIQRTRTALYQRTTGHVHVESSETYLVLFCTRTIF